MFSFNSSLDCLGVRIPWHFLIAHSPIVVSVSTNPPASIHYLRTRTQWVHSPTSCCIHIRTRGESSLISRCLAKTHGKEILNQNTLNHFSWMKASHLGETSRGDKIIDCSSPCVESLRWKQWMAASTFSACSMQIQRWGATQPSLTTNFPPK